MEPNIITHRLVSQVVQEDGTLVNEWEEREQPLDLSDHHVFHDQRWTELRRQRDRLLAQSDWVVARANELGEPVPEEWLAYRQALRDLTNQENPFFVVWPVKPEIDTAPVIVYPTDGAQP